MAPARRISRCSEPGGGRTTAGYSGHQNRPFDDLLSWNSPFADTRMLEASFPAPAGVEHFDLVRHADFRDYAWLYLTRHRLRFAVLHRWAGGDSGFGWSAGTDGYGVDRCLANGENCGRAAANSYCQSHQFAQAASYRKVDREEITGAIPADASGGCKSGRCDNLVAIVCTK